ncbi:MULTISPECIES: DNA gyrase inhibitor YacG [Nguyenibacter]|uniref:DNA gyrase inhibitor YacG n=1 Tax=Nguyenibacter vanlangensis TaxID=1216886 RepID=A0A7Y7M690_9PROT|nr:MULTISPECIES: DNA gyrase inhibitor YacG [Nguyenibacter]NVN10253.1 DNA gyrase inhibitor YacG [Nguyenibacter vanlangensis]WRH86398.1 DNA gyrase inhibitor YacG [Nguyenibacter sp. L1]
MTVTEPTALPPCPICGRPGDPTFRPFCSRRCADIDLGHWFTERYRVPDSDEGSQIFDENESRRVDPDDEVG